MRKFHLLLAEWRFAQQLEYGRFYKLILCWCGKEPPAPEEIFPMLDNAPADPLENADDFVIFNQAAAALGAS